MNIYKDYITNIERALNSEDSPGFINESNNYIKNYFQKGFSNVTGQAPSKEINLLPSLRKFASFLGLKPNFDQQLGLHPDFAHLKGSSRREKHYILSVFIDIKGSTNLFKKYSPQKVLVINDIIQKAAIHTCIMFGGYVHRLQGDGLFVYFGGKNIKVKDAVSQSLLSSSVFSYFMNVHLKESLEKKDIKGIYTRVGIDLGNHDDVIWSDAGIGSISEVTSCSLHTSLAPKMQSNAQSNGIVVGHNLKDKGLLVDDLMTPVYHRTGEESDRYIFKNPDTNFYYTQYDFNGEQFLRRQKFIATDMQGNYSFQIGDKSLDSSNEDIFPIARTNRPYFSNK